jgi:hypothetical protein
MNSWIKYCIRYLLFIGIFFIFPIIDVAIIETIRKGFNHYNDLDTISIWLYIGLLFLTSILFGSYHYFGEKYMHERHSNFNKTFILIFFVNSFILIGYPITYFYYGNFVGLIEGQLISLLTAVFFSLIISFIVNRLTERFSFIKIGLYGFFIFFAFFSIPNLLHGLREGISKLTNEYFVLLAASTVLFILVSLISWINMIGKQKNKNNWR